ncbi:MAG: hemerythrin family protein [Candidatus Accumulibacter sp.]|jgi:hemerythrin-like metal-binding protein|nr:hemerythrin family protein [Accumulibacter sp.]
MNHALLIQWSDVNSSGIPIIDDQHQGIVSVINSLAYFVRQNKGEYFLNTAFAMMDSYSKLHFTTEEDLLRAAGYAHLADHQRLHGNLVRESFFKASESFRLHDPRIYLDFLKNWWVDHINVQDQKFAETVGRYVASLPS